MNNEMSNTKKINIKQPIVILLLVVFCVAVFSSPVAATQYDPNNWTVVDRVNPTNAESGDDNGWVDPHQSPPDVWYLLRYSLYSPTFYWLYDILLDVDHGDNGVTNPNDQNNDPDVRPIRTTSSD